MKSGSPLSDEELRQLVRQRINDGRLPVTLSQELWAGHGTGLICSACAEPIGSEQVEYEVDLSGGVRLLFHPRCHVQWQLECVGRLPARSAARVEVKAESKLRDAG